MTRLHLALLALVAAVLIAVGVGAKWDVPTGAITAGVLLLVGVVVLYEPQGKQ